MTVNVNDFKKVCATFNEGYEMFERTEKIYNFLKASKEKMTPTEIALALGYSYKWFNDEDVALIGRVSKPLHWLLEMGLVEKEPYSKTYTFETEWYGKEYWVQDEKIIDGITYTAMIRKEREGDTFEETFTLYKWFAK